MIISLTCIDSTCQIFGVYNDKEMQTLRKEYFCQRLLQEVQGMDKEAELERMEKTRKRIQEDEDNIEAGEGREIC